jgi:hypothetical protein
MSKHHARSSSVSYGPSLMRTRESLTSLINFANIDRIIVDEANFSRKRLSMEAFQYNPDHVAKNSYLKAKRNSSQVSSLTDLRQQKSTALNSVIIPASTISLNQSPEPLQDKHHRSIYLILNLIA